MTQATGTWKITIITALEDLMVIKCAYLWVMHDSELLVIM